MLRLPQLGIGPIVRAAGRQKSAFSLVVLQLATGFVIAGSLVDVGSWIRRVGHMSYGYQQTDLVGVHVREPRTVADGVARPPTPAPLLKAVAALPGVAAAASLSPPLRAQTGAPTLYRADARAVRGWTAFASPSLIDVLGLSFVEGGLPAGPTEDGVDALVISKELRDKLFAPTDHAVGRLLTSDDARPGRIVGVVTTFLLREPFWENASFVAVHLAAPVDTDAWSFVVRAHPGQRAAVAETLRRFAGGEGPARSISVTSYGLTPPRFQSVAEGLVTLFVDIGLTIAIIALVGAVAVSSFVVAARRREIGIRRALGATRGDVLRYFLIESTLAAALGTGIGLVVTVALLVAMREAMGNLPIGGWQLAIAAVFMWGNATAAALLPARRAARLSPTLATRGG